jgi:hypothetical protein
MMDENTLMKISRKIEYMVHKRHRSLRHIQKAVSKEGCFWLNSVNINKHDICKYSSSNYGPTDMKMR